LLVENEIDWLLEAEGLLPVELSLHERLCRA